MNRRKIYHLRCRQRWALRKRQRWNRYVKRRNKWHNQSKHKRERTSMKRSYMSVTLPSHFCESNIEDIFCFVNKMSVHTKSKRNLRHIFIDMASVKDIDSVGICILLSQIYKLAGHFISTRGNFPNDKTAKDLFIASGFLDLVNSNIRSSKTKESQNILYQLGGSNVESKRIGNSIKKTVEILTGRSGHFGPIYENMIEICANSVEHANKKYKDKNWIVSISFKDNAAFFLLVDTGEGILKTLRKKSLESLSDFFKKKTDGEVLDNVFCGGYRSQTEEINRHLGLPNVLQSFNDGYINDLKVVTNHVMYDFKLKKEVKLRNEFHGTMFQWSITKDNIELWQKEN